MPGGELNERTRKRYSIRIARCQLPDIYSRFIRVLDGSRLESGEQIHYETSASAFAVLIYIINLIINSFVVVIVEWNAVEISLHPVR